MDLSHFDQDTLAKFNQAKQAGVPDQVNYQKAASYQASKQQQQPQQHGDFLSTATDLLPLIGGIGGSFTPLGPIAGGAAGAGLGTLLKQAIQGKGYNAGDIAKETALSAVGGVAGKGLGFALGKILPGFGSALGDVGENLAVRGFRPTASQITNFTANTGEDFGKFLTNRGITHIDEVAQRAEKLQNAFDSVVNNKNLNVNSTDILDGFKGQIDRLSHSINPADQQKAQTLSKIAENYVNEYGTGPISADKLTALRKQLDQGIKDFHLDETVKGPLNLARDVFQNTLRNTADNAGITLDGNSLKDTGVELSKLYQALEIGQRQANLGRGSLPIGLTKLLGGVVGGSVGGVPGAVAGMTATGAVNDPRVISLLSQFATKAGGAVDALPQLTSQGAENITRAGVATGAGLGSIPQADASQGQTGQPDLSGFDTSTSQGAGQPQDKQQLLRQVLASIMFKNAKSVSDIKTAFDFLSPATKPLTATQQQLKANAESGLRSISTVENILAKDPTAPLKANVPILGGRSPYAAAAKEVADVFTRLRTGAALNESEQKFYASQLPQPFDSAETIKYKLNIFRNLFNQFATGQTPDVSGSTNSLTQ